MLRIVTVNWQNYEGRGVEYTNILFDSVRRNLADGFEGKFTVFTDNPNGKYGHGVDIRLLPEGLDGWWNKLWLFSSGLFDDGDRIVYFDLDTLITGRLDEIVAYDGPFAILRDFFRPDGLGSAVMAWRAGEATKIWEKYAEAGCPTDDEGGDQSWIEQFYLHKAVRLQNAFPDLFVSYKLINDKPPDKASVVVFHGRPRPHEVARGWVPEVWKLGGMTRAELDVICNTKKEELASNVKSAMARDLTWFDTAPEHLGHVVIVGGGPSLAGTLDEIRWRKSVGQKIWALNGVAKYLYTNCIVPDAVIIADARPGNREFLDWVRCPVYLASQCHPDVFDGALHSRSLEVILWHVNTEGMVDVLKDERERPVHLIGGGSTVGMNAIVLAFAAGYRKIHLHGFDSCYKSDKHHAYPQHLNDGELVFDALYRDQRFRSAAWMVQQVNDFQNLAPDLLADGCIITAHGEGLFQMVADDVIVNTPPTLPQVRANEILRRICGIGAPVGVEVGVFAGEMSRALLDGHEGLHLTMVDSWEGDAAAYTGDSGDWHAGLSQTTQESFYEAALNRTVAFHDRRYVMRKRSTDAAKHFVDRSLDFVFIDADHSYEGCAADIAALAPKVKPGGLLCGHDYENTGCPKFGVTQAVNEFVAASGLELELGDNFCWFIRTNSLPQTERSNNVRRRQADCPEVQVLHSQERGEVQGRRAAHL